MKYFALALMLVVALPAFARGGGFGGGHSGGSSHSGMRSYGTGAKASHEHVEGYTRKDGKRVEGYDRSTADSTKNNNWSTKGNTNPETGKEGTKRGDE